VERSFWRLVVHHVHGYHLSEELFMRYLGSVPFIIARRVQVVRAGLIETSSAHWRNLNLKFLELGSSL